MVCVCLFKCGLCLKAVKTCPSASLLHLLIETVYLCICVSIKQGQRNGAGMGMDQLNNWFTGHTILIMVKVATIATDGNDWMIKVVVEFGVVVAGDVCVSLWVDLIVTWVNCVYLWP